MMDRVQTEVPGFPDVAVRALGASCDGKGSKAARGVCENAQSYRGGTGYACAGGETPHFLLGLRMLGDLTVLVIIPSVSGASFNTSALLSVPAPRGLHSPQSACPACSLGATRRHRVLGSQ